MEHEILLTKSDHYGLHGVANDWFRSYQSNRQQFVSTGGVESEMKIMKYGVPKGSVLGPLLFLIYINDLHSAKLCITHHFDDDMNLLTNHLNNYVNI